MMAAELLLLGFFLIFAAGVVYEAGKTLVTGARWLRARRAVARYGESMASEAERYANGA